MTNGTTGNPGCWAALPVLIEGASRLAIRLDESQQRLFAAYCHAITDGNARLNLTGVRDPEGIMKTLFLDSLTLDAALQPYLSPERGEVTLVDIGSGGGLPGIPLAIMHPRWNVRLVDSIGKKVTFIAETASRLDLTGVTSVQARAEDLGSKPPYRDAADVCTARAVAPLATLLEYCAPLVRTGGLLVFPKSGNIAGEVADAAPAARCLHAELAASVPVPGDLGLGSGRATIIYQKTGSTPPGYPRRVGLARSRPIGTK